MAQSISYKCTFNFKQQRENIDQSSRRDKDMVTLSSERMLFSYNMCTCGIQFQPCETIWVIL